MAPWLPRGGTAPRRREFLRLVGPAGVGALASLAGCPAPGRSAFERVDRGAGDTATGPADRPSPTPDASGFRREPDYGGWFDGVENYDGTVVYRRQTPEVTVQVGAPGNGDYRAFEPAAIAVPVGTTVVWRWTGAGGPHNVVEEHGEFDSGPPVEGDGLTFAVEFDTTGVFRYASESSASVGMRGSVAVYR